MGRPKASGRELGRAVLDTLGPGPWPDTVVAAVCGVSQQAVNRELRAILTKLRRHGEFIAAQRGLRLETRGQLLELLGDG